MNINAVLRVPFYEAVRAFHGRHLVDAEWQDFCAVLLKWADVVRDLIASPPTRSLRPTAGWARRRHRNRRPPPSHLVPPASEGASPSANTSASTSTATTPHRGRRASGHQRAIDQARLLQRLYRTNPSVCIRKILDDTPPTYCTIPEADLVAHFSSTYAPPPPPPLYAPPSLPWKFNTK